MNSNTEICTSIIEDLKRHFGDALNPGLLDVFIVESPEFEILEYTNQNTDECTITYRHDLRKWSDNSYTEEEMLAKGFSKRDLEQIAEEEPYSAVDHFLGEYMMGDVTTLLMITELFTEEGGSKLMEGGDTD
jgi:hypothetical protein